MADGSRPSARRHPDACRGYQSARAIESFGLRSRPPRRAGPGKGRGLAPRHSRTSRAVQPRNPHRRSRRTASALAGTRGPHRGRTYRRDRRAARWQAGPRRRGAALMIEEGALDDPKPSAIFGLHVLPYPTGEIRYRPGGTMASADAVRIVVHGRQTHGALPWAGIDPIVIASQIVMGLQTITSRQIDVTTAPAV